jgi:hypothetical protein
VSPHTADAERHRERKHAAGQQHHVLARDGQQVVQPRTAERLLRPIGQAAVVSEQHPFDERAPFSREPGG